MHLYDGTDGRKRCYHCNSVCDPWAKFHAETDAIMRRIPSDEDAARVFFYTRRDAASAAKRRTLWVDGETIFSHDIGPMEFQGIEFNLNPGVRRKDVLRYTDDRLLPFIRRFIVEALDGAHKEAGYLENRFQVKLKTPEQLVAIYKTRHTPAARLYKHGYVRTADGGIQPLTPHPNQTL